MGGLIENILSIVTGPDTQRNYTLMGATQADVERIAAEHDQELCLVCKSPIKTMVFRGTGVCGENHLKMVNDHQPHGNDWYHTVAMNLRNHLMHKVRFSLPDPWTIFEGTIGSAVWGDDDEFIEITLMDGYTSQQGRPAGWEPIEPRVHEEGWMVQLANYKVVEVLPCR